MAGNFNVSFNGSAATNVKTYNYSQSNLTHNAGTTRMNTETEIDYGEVEEFDYNAYLANNQTPQQPQQPQYNNPLGISPEEIIALRKELEGYGFIESDIHRLLQAEISLEDLYKEIENDTDGTRRRRIYEASYLSSLGSEFNNISDLQRDINNTNRRIQKLKEEQGAFDFTEEEAAYGLLMALAMYGGDLDEIAETYIVGWAYEDAEGVTRYEYCYNPNYMGGFYGATPIYYNDVFPNSKYLEQIRASLVETTRTRGWPWSREEYTAYEWQGTEEQLALADFLTAKKDEAIENREKKQSEYQAEIDSLTTKKLQEEAILEYINQELNHYMENVDAYIHKPNFLDKSGMNADLRERAETINASTKENMYSYDETLPSKVVSGKENGMAVIAAVVNKTGDFYCTSGMIFSRESYTQITFSDSKLKNYTSWIPFMQEDEIQVFNYIYNTEGADAAYDYLVKISDELDSRWLMDRQQKDAEWAREHPFLASAASVVITPFEGMNAAINSLGSVLTGNEIRRVDVYSSGDVFRQAVSQDIYEHHGEVAAFFYNTGMSMADSGLLIAGTVVTGGALGAVGVSGSAATTAANVILSTTTMGSRAYVSTLNDALDRGLNDGTAVTLAFSSAAVETLMESYSVGHLMNLEGALGDASTNLLRRVTASISDPKLQQIVLNSGYIALGALSQGLCEGEEELCTEIFNHYLDEMIAGDLSNYNISIRNHMMEGLSEEEARRLATEEYHDQIQQAFLGGMVSGGVFGGAQTTYQTYSYSNRIAQSINTEYRVNGLTDIEQTMRNQIMASILGIDGRYQDVCIAGLTGNLTQEQIASAGLGGLFALKEAVENYQRYDSTMTLENIFENVSENHIEDTIEKVNDYQAPLFKEIFKKILGKGDTNTDSNINSNTLVITDPRLNFILNIPLDQSYQETILNSILQYEQMDPFLGCTVTESVAIRIIDDSLSIPDQKQVGKQFVRAAYFYLLNNGMESQNAVEFVTEYINTSLKNMTVFNTKFNHNYGFKINFSAKISADLQQRLYQQFESNFALLPTVLQSQIREVNFYDTYNPYDVYWECNYNIGNFQSAATGGGGVINFWTGVPSLGTLAHEAAHCYDTALAASWGATDRISTSQVWLNAMQQDQMLNGKTGVTDYAVNSNSSVEDFAESIALYITNPSALDAFPNRKQVIANYFKNIRVSQLSSEISTISDLIYKKYGYKFQDVLTNYYIYGAHIDSELEQILSKYTVNEMYEVVGFSSLLENSRVYNFSDYQQTISKAIDNLVQKVGLTNAINIMNEYLNTGRETLLTRDMGIRFDITKFGIDGIRQYVSNLSNGNMDVNKLFSKYYLANEINVIRDIAYKKYGSQSFEQIVYEYFIHGASLDLELEAYLRKYSNYDFLEVLNFNELQDTATMYTLDHYKQSIESAMDTLISKYGFNQAIKIFEDYLKTGDKFLLTRDNNVRFEISKFGIENLTSYINGTYNGKSIQTIFYEYQVSNTMQSVQNQITSIYGNVDMEHVLREYYVHGAKIDASIESLLSMYTAEEISSVLGMNSLVDTYRGYIDSDYHQALSLAFNTLIDKFGFNKAIELMDEYFSTGEIGNLTRDNNVRFEISKFDLQSLKSYLADYNPTLFILENVETSKIDISKLDVTSLTAEQIKQFIGPYAIQFIQTNDSIKNFINKEGLSSFFGDVPANIRGRLQDNIESKTPKTLLEFRETLTAAEQQQFDNYLQNTIEGRWLATLTSEEIYAINLYTKNYYKEINAELRTKNVEHYFDVIQAIDSALSKFTLQEDTILWRALTIGGLSHLGITDYAGIQTLVGKKFFDLGYMSTSPAYQCSFAKWDGYPVVFKIKAPAGTMGAYINQLSDFYNTENEFLLGRGTVLTIENVIKETVNGQEKIMIEATVVDNIAGNLNDISSSNNVQAANNTTTTTTTVSVNPELEELSEFDKKLLFGYTVTGQEDAVSPGTLTDVFEEINVTAPMIPINVLNAIALNSTVLNEVLNDQTNITSYDQQDLKAGVKNYIAASLKMMEQTGNYDFELIESVLSTDLSSSISQDFMYQMIEKSILHNSYECYDNVISYLKTLDNDSKYYYLLGMTGLNLDSDMKSILLKKLFASSQELRESTYAHAYSELKQSMYDTFGITDDTVIEGLLNSLLGSKQAFINDGINNSELDWNHFVEQLSPYIKEKVAVYDPSKPPVLWSKVDCSKLNEKYTTIENSTIGEGLYFLDLVFSNWNSDIDGMQKLENLWNILSEEFARDLCQMKVSDGSIISSLRFIFPGVEDFGGPFGDIFKNVEFVEILKNGNIKSITLDAVLSDDVFTSKIPSVTIDLDYFRSLVASSNSSYAYEVAFEEFKGMVAAKFLNENFTYFDVNDSITSLMNNISPSNGNNIAFTAFKNNLSKTISDTLFGGI